MCIERLKFGVACLNVIFRTLNRPYARVDRLKLKDRLITDCLDAGVQFHLGRAKGCSHDDDGSKLACLDDLVISASFVIDATGHARKLTKMDGEHNPGYQAAYGIMAGVHHEPRVLSSAAVQRHSCCSLPRAVSTNSHRHYS